VAKALVESLLGGVPRALILVDRMTGSPTYGSGDRAYWRYRSLVDFPGATWQQPMLGLLIAHDLDHPKNHWHARNELIVASRSMLIYWTRIQNPNGSFNEWYRNEQSYCATAFTTAAASLTLFRLNSRLTKSELIQVENSLKHALNWLSRHENSQVSNQDFAALVAFFTAAEIFPDSGYLDLARSRLDRVLARQTPAGWFPEYGGLDFGYSSLSLDLMALADSHGAELRRAADLVASFLLKSIAPDGTYPAPLGQRGTGHSFGFGSLYFSQTSAACRALANLWTENVANRITKPEFVDDRYFAYFYLNSYCLSAEHLSISTPGQLSRDSSIGKPPAQYVTNIAPGLIRFPLQRSQVFVSAHSGGVAIWHPKTGWHYHLGYRLVDKKKRHYGTAGGKGADFVKTTSSSYIAKTHFIRINTSRPLDRFAILFRLATILFSYPSLAKFAGVIAKKLFIFPHSRSTFFLIRSIEIRVDEVIISDRIEGGSTRDRQNVTNLWPCQLTPTYCPSNQLDANAGMIKGDWDNRIELKKLSSSEVWERTMRLTICDSGSLIAEVTDQ